MMTKVHKTKENDFYLRWPHDRWGVPGHCSPAGIKLVLEKQSCIFSLYRLKFQLLSHAENVQQSVSAEPMIQICQ